MSVLVCMLTLVPGHMGGSETYARELLRELGGRDLDVSAAVAPVGRGFSPGVPERVAEGYRTGPTTALRTTALVRGLLRPRGLRQDVGDATVVHFPFSVVVPRPNPSQRTLVSLLDVQHHDLPQMFSRAERAYRAATYDRAARGARAVITISQFAKNRIVATLGIPAQRIHVAPLGVRRDEFTPRLGGREPFLLYPAKGWGHKNHSTLFEAFRLLRETEPALELVLTGARPDELADVPPGVQVRGQVTREELVDLYGRAAALVFPSRYEGFGLPVVEAMSSGCPVAAADAGSLPEVVADAGVLFDPSDPEDLARGVQEALQRRDDLQQRGLLRAREFSWAACADVHVDLYRALGG